MKQHVLQLKTSSSQTSLKCPQEKNRNIVKPFTSSFTINDNIIEQKISLKQILHNNYGKSLGIKPNTPFVDQSLAWKINLRSDELMQEDVHSPQHISKLKNLIRINSIKMKLLSNQTQYLNDAAIALPSIIKIKGISQERKDKYPKQHTNFIYQNHKGSRKRFHYKYSIFPNNKTLHNFQSKCKSESSSVNNEDRGIQHHYNNNQNEKQVKCESNVHNLKPVKIRNKSLFKENEGSHYCISDLIVINNQSKNIKDKNDSLPILSQSIQEYPLIENQQKILNDYNTSKNQFKERNAEKRNSKNCYSDISMSNLSNKSIHPNYNHPSISRQNLRKKLLLESWNINTLNTKKSAGNVLISNIILQQALNSKN